MYYSFIKHEMFNQVLEFSISGSFWGTVISQHPSVDQGSSFNKTCWSWVQLYIADPSLILQGKQAPPTYVTFSVSVHNKTLALIFLDGLDSLPTAEYVFWKQCKRNRDRTQTRWRDWSGFKSFMFVQLFNFMFINLKFLKLCDFQNYFFTAN